MSTKRPDTCAEEGTSPDKTTTSGIPNGQIEDNTQYVAPFYPFDGEPLEKDFYMGRYFNKASTIYAK